MRKKQREITNEERQKILEEFPQYIELCGVQNFQRAKFISMVAKEVMKSDSDLFLHIKPRIYDHSDKNCWSMAYSIVKYFLTDNDCLETLRTLNNEINDKFQIENENLNYEGNSDDFDDLLNFIPTEDEISMDFKVRRFLTQFDNSNQAESNQPTENIADPLTSNPTNNEASISKDQSDDGLIDINDFSSDEFAVKSDTKEESKEPQQEEQTQPNETEENDGLLDINDFSSDEFANKSDTKEESKDSQQEEQTQPNENEESDGLLDINDFSSDEFAIK